MKLLVTLALVLILSLMAISPALAAESCPAPGEPGFTKHLMEMRKKCDRDMFVKCTRGMVREKDHVCEHQMDGSM